MNKNAKKSTLNRNRLHSDKDDLPIKQTSADADAHATQIIFQMGDFTAVISLYV